MSSLKKLKDLIGPVAVTPSVTKQSQITGTGKLDTQGTGVTIEGKFGSINLNKGRVTESPKAARGHSFTTKSKGINYRKQFKPNKKTTVELNLNKGKTQDYYKEKRGTHGGSLSITRVLGGKSTGGFIHNKSSQKKYYKDII